MFAGLSQHHNIYFWIFLIWITDNNQKSTCLEYRDSYRVFSLKSCEVKILRKKKHYQPYSPSLAEFLKVYLQIYYETL
jgi:hypothetical protein